MEKKTEINQIEITRDGYVQIRIALMIMDGTTEVSNKWHRTMCLPGSDIDIQFALVDSHLTQMGYPVTPQEDIDRVKALAAAAWTPDVVSAFQELMGASA